VCVRRRAAGRTDSPETRAAGTARGANSTCGHPAALPDRYFGRGFASNRHRGGCRTSFGFRSDDIGADRWPPFGAAPAGRCGGFGCPCNLGRTTRVRPRWSTDTPVMSANSCVGTITSPWPQSAICGLRLITAPVRFCRRRPRRCGSRACPPALDGETGRPALSTVC